MADGPVNVRRDCLRWLVRLWRGMVRYFRPLSWKTTDRAGNAPPAPSFAWAGVRVGGTGGGACTGRECPSGLRMADREDPYSLPPAARGPDRHHPAVARAVLTAARAGPRAAGSARERVHLVRPPAGVVAPVRRGDHRGRRADH